MQCGYRRGMSDIAGFPTGDSPLETPAPAADSYTELPADQLGLAAPYAPLTETDTTGPCDDDPAAPGDDADDQASHVLAAGQTRIAGTPVPAASGSAEPWSGDPASVPVIAPQITGASPPRPGTTPRG